MRTFATQSDQSAARRFPGAALLLLLCALVVYAIPSLTTTLQFQRSLFEQGQWWRLITCHWTHFSTDHLFWDLIMFALLGAICERFSRMRTLVCLAASTLLISITVWLFAPELTTYRGLSGLDSALFTLLLSMLIRPAFAEKRWSAVASYLLLLLLFGAKVAYESITAATLFADHTAGGFVPVPLAHAVGAAIGLLIGLGGATIKYKQHHLCKYSVVQSR